MRSWRFVSAMAILACCLSCTSPREGIDVEAETNALLATDRAWAAAAAAGDIEKLTAFWADDATNYFPGAPVARGRDAIGELVRRNRSQPGFSLSWEPQKAVVARTGDLGYTSGTFALSMEGPEASPITRTGHYICIWRKQTDGAWKCSVESTVFGPAAAGAEQNDDEGAKRKASAERFFRGMYGGDPSVVDDLAADDIVISYPIFQSIFGKPTLRGRQAVKEFAGGFGKRWADPQISIEDVIGEADRVVLRWSYRARDVGSRPGGPPPTNQAHGWGGITIYRFDKTGKIVAEVGEESDPIPVQRIGAGGGEK
ncbi:MAG: DUF4440 domain-containing protein [Gemmatimonadales bacterium]|nr:MAG: DUF4440 domain-containing protein [Gemmatimonadales bacterium]